jgi:hypothetical protein
MTYNLSKIQLNRINLCCLYLQVNWISDITSADRLKILPIAVEGKEIPVE